LDRLRNDSLKRIHHDIGNQLQRRLRDLPSDATVSEAITAVGDEFDAQRWRVERTARTETSYAFNQAQANGVGLLQKEFPGLMQRWTEMVDDATGMPLDAAVAWDSIAMHGQVTPPGGVFTMPSDPRVSAKMIGQQWNHPPNRPNDRAVLTPWHKGWGIPAWVWQGRRITLRT